MRRISVWFLACWSLAAMACAARRPAPAPADAVARLTAADRLLRDGCFDCFAAAYEKYNALQHDPAIGSKAVVGATEAAILMAVREAEFGLAEGPRRELTRSISDASWSSL